MNLTKTLAFVVVVGCSGSVIAAPEKINSKKEAATTKAAQEMMRASFKTRGQASVDRLNQDETQALCSQYQDNPPKPVRAKIEAINQKPRAELPTVS